MITYDLRGTFYEACDCEVICPCWAGLPPDMGSCTGLFVWHIFEGEIDGVDVRNSRVVVLSSGKSCDESKYMLVLIHSSHPDKIQSAFESTGAWKDVFNLQPDLTAAQRFTRSATIEIEGHHLSATIADPITNQIHTLASVDFIDKPVHLVGSPHSNVLADRVVGIAKDRSVKVGVVTSPTPQHPDRNGLNLLADILDPITHKPLYTFDLNISRVTAMRGHFRYKH
jgi:Protein of unknown function (DUF1326)